MQQIFASFFMIFWSCLCTSYSWFAAKIELSLEDRFRLVNSDTFPVPWLDVKIWPVVCATSHCCISFFSLFLCYAYKQIKHRNLPNNCLNISVLQQIHTTTLSINDAVFSPPSSEWKPKCLEWEEISALSCKTEFWKQYRQRQWCSDWVREEWAEDRGETPQRGMFILPWGERILDTNYSCASLTPHLLRRVRLFLQDNINIKKEDYKVTTTLKLNDWGCKKIFSRKNLSTIVQKWVDTFFMKHNHGQVLLLLFMHFFLNSWVKKRGLGILWYFLIANGAATFGIYLK